MPNHSIHAGHGPERLLTTQTFRFDSFVFYQVCKALVRRIEELDCEQISGAVVSIDADDDPKRLFPTQVFHSKYHVF